MSVRACSQTIRRRWHLFMARDYVRMKNARSMSTVRCSFYCGDVVDVVAFVGRINNARCVNIGSGCCRGRASISV